MRRVFLAAVLLAVAPVAAMPSSAALPLVLPDPAQRATTLATMPLIIRTGHRSYIFRVEVARTSMEQERGLMFRKKVAPFGGMLFPFDPPRPASFWMRNTLVPLDIVFVRPNGSIARIAAMTTPLSLDRIEEGEPMAAVLELRGRAAALGITEAARVSWRGGPAA